MNNLPIVHAVVTNYNGGDIVLKSIRSLLDQEGSFDLKVTIVDDCSKDNSFNIIKKTFQNEILMRKMSLCKTPVNGGVAKAYNFGINRHLEDSDFTLKMDNDLQITKGAIAALLGSMDKDTGIVGGKIILMRNQNKLQFAYMDYKSFLGVPILFPVGSNVSPDDKLYNVKKDVVGVCGPMMLFRNTLFKKIGLFDESYNRYGAEDFDFEFLALVNNYKIIYEPKAIGIHYVSLSSKNSKRSRAVSSARNRIIFHRRFFKGWAFWGSVLGYTGFLINNWLVNGYPLGALLYGHILGIRDSMKEKLKVDFAVFYKKYNTKI